MKFVIELQGLKRQGESPLIGNPTKIACFVVFLGMCRCICVRKILFLVTIRNWLGDAHSHVSRHLSRFSRPQGGYQQSPPPRLSLPFQEPFTKLFMLEEDFIALIEVGSEIQEDPCTCDPSVCVSVSVCEWFRARISVFAGLHVWIRVST